METRANYVLIGVFTLLGIFAALGAILWLAKVHVERQYAYYDVLFDNVSGLSNAGDVRYNGLPVGRVVDLQLEQTDPSKVRVRLEVDATTPIKTDTIARLQALGVTGVSFVGLSGGSAEAARQPDGGTIQSQRSTLDSLFEDAPELLNTAIDLLKDLREVVDRDNSAAVTQVLQNAASASERLDQVLSDFEGLSGDLSAAAHEVANFTSTLEQLSDTAEVTLNTATETLSTATEAIRQTEGAINAAVATLDSADSAFQTADGLMQNQLTAFVEQGTAAAQSLENIVETLEPTAQAILEAARVIAEDQLPTLLTEVTAAAGTVNTQINSVGAEATQLMSQLEDLSTSVQARVEQTQTAIAAFETALTAGTETITAIGETSEAATRFIEREATNVANDAVEALDAARRAGQRLSDAIDQANLTMSTIGRETTAFSTDARTLMATANDRLTEAEDTLSSLNAAIDQASETLQSVETTSDSVNTLITGDGAQLVAEARVAASNASDALVAINTAVQQELPGLVEDVRSAASTANRAINDVGPVITDLGARLETLSEAGVTALASATTTFDTANGTLNAIAAAVGNAEETLDNVDATFVSINRIIDEDIDAIAADIRIAATTFTGTVQNVATDVTRVSEQILSASASTANLVGTIEGIVEETRRQVSDFLRLGLPALRQFIEEGQRLVGNLDRLVDRFERDPARFLLGTQSRDFRR